MDLEGVFLSLAEARVAQKEKRQTLVECSFMHYDDNDILSIPASVIVQERRSASLGNRALAVGDVCSSDLAVLRVPDSEALISDFTPHLEWGSYNPAPEPRVGKYRINRTIANKGIAPRVAEPAPPAQTSLPTMNVTDDDTPLAPIEKALVKGVQVIQLLRRAGGDGTALASLLGKVWGDEALFDGSEQVDVLGDPSLPRILAKGSKRRFETYRNIGFTSLVSAGGASVTSNAYGSSAILNWQRRVELAKLFLHFAQALEGAELLPGSKFQITARIPSFTVPHCLWEDLAIAVDPDVYPTTPSLGIYTKRAVSFIKTGLSESLKMVSDYVRARGNILDEPALLVAAKYDQLTYLDPLAKKLETRALKSELAFATATSHHLNLIGQYKAHDVRVAVLETLMATGITKQEVYHTLSTFSALIHLDPNIHMPKYREFLLSILTETPLLLSAARVVANRPSSYEERHRKAEWSRIARLQLPDSLLATDDVYNPATIALGTLHTMYRDSTSQARRTVLYNISKSKELLDSGIRRRRILCTKGDVDLANAIHAEIHAFNRAFYRERYRRNGRVWQNVAQYAQSNVWKNQAVLESAFWFARSDAAHLSELNVQNGVVSVNLSPKRELSVAAVYLANIKKVTRLEAPKLKSLKGEELWFAVKEHAESAHKAANIPLKIDQLIISLEKFLNDTRRDHEPVEDTSHEEEDRPVASANNPMDLLMQARLTPPKRKATIDNMVSYWASVSGANAYMDPDELDELIEWMEEYFAEMVHNPADYIATHSEKLDKKEAGKLLDEWIDMKDADEDTDVKKNANEIA